MLVFEHIGGVPPVIVMDNATGAAGAIAKGEVALTGVFSAFVRALPPEVRFCNPYSGNEKGSAGERGRLLRRTMVPPMRAESWAVEPSPCWSGATGSPGPYCPEVAGRPWPRCSTRGPR